MARIRIKTLDERVATQGIHMGGGHERRKLQPFEVVDVPESEMLPDGRRLIDALLDTNKVELTLDEITRPFDYESYLEARYCSPTFKPREPSEALEAERAQAAVAMRLSQQADAETSEAVEQPDVPAKPAPRKKVHRAARRRTLQADDNGEALTA